MRGRVDLEVVVVTAVVAAGAAAEALLAVHPLRNGKTSVLNPSTPLDPLRPTSSSLSPGS